MSKVIGSKCFNRDIIMKVLKSYLIKFLSNSILCYCSDTDAGDHKSGVETDMSAT